jgi:hypothetical protein
MMMLIIAGIKSFESHKGDLLPKPHSSLQTPSKPLTDLLMKASR